MRVITPKAVTEAMRSYPQWKIGLKLWLDRFDGTAERFESYQYVRELWKATSGWNTDRIPARNLSSDSKKGPLDMYVFDIHKNDCRLLAWGSPLANTFYIQGIYSHADYDKWCKHKVKN